jgi:hypothetical protein
MIFSSNRNNPALFLVNVPARREGNCPPGDPDSTRARGINSPRCQAPLCDPSTNLSNRVSPCSTSRKLGLPPMALRWRLRLPRAMLPTAWGDYSMPDRVRSRRNEVKRRVSDKQQRGCGEHQFSLSDGRPGRYLFGASQLGGAALSKYMIVYDPNRPAKSECQEGDAAP